MENSLLFEFLAALGGLTAAALVTFNPHRIASKVALAVLLWPVMLGLLKVLVVVSGPPDASAVEAVTAPLVSQLLEALPSLVISGLAGFMAGVVFTKLVAPVLRVILD